MKKILNQLLLIVLTVFFSSTITFVLIRIMPGDPVQTLAMEMQRSYGISLEDAYARAQSTLNYDPDVPIFTQYVNYLENVVTGDFGDSMQFKRPVTEVIAGGLSWTLFILSISLAVAFVLGTILGMYIAWKRKTWVDPAVTVYASAVGAIPEFLVGYLLVILFSVVLGWFPARGPYDSAITPGFNLEFMLSACYHAVLPISAYILTQLGFWAMGMKGVAVSILGEDFITSARARGLSDKRIITAYVGRNALLPQITSLAITFGVMFGGSALVENIFVYPGVGFYMGRAIASRDYTLMQGLFLMITVVVVIANVVAELLYSVLDPRIRKR